MQPPLAPPEGSRVPDLQVPRGSPWPCLSLPTAWAGKDLISVSWAYTGFNSLRPATAPAWRRGSLVPEMEVLPCP